MTDFVQLQLRMKRDPPGYREDFLQQCRFFMSNLQIFKLQPFAKAGRSMAETASIFKQDKKPEKPSQRSASSGLSQGGPVQSRRVEEFCALIAFISYTSHMYADEVRKLQIPRELFALLFNHCESLDPYLRKTLVQALILMQDKNLIPRMELLPALFRCFRCADKELRDSVFSHIVSDIQKLQRTNPSVSMTTSLQKLVFSMMKEEHPGVALKAMYILVELWKRKTWINDKVVNALATMCFSKDDKLTSAGLYFFLGDYDTRDEDDEALRQQSLSKTKEIVTVQLGLKHIKRRMKKQREIERSKKSIKRVERDLEAHEDDDMNLHINPLNMLYDAQNFTERLFYKLKTSRETFNTRMLMMNVISKLIGMNKLLLFNFFPFIQRYLTPTQRHVTSLLSFVARATHNLIPPEVLHPVIKTIANHFVTDRSTPEVIAVGINAIREVCSRSPLVMNETLLQDLTEYARHKNKSIMSATRSLIQVFRDLNPSMLKRKDRGREGQMILSVVKNGGIEGERIANLKNLALEYGAEYVHKDIDGLELLEEAERLEAKKRGRAINHEDDDWDSDVGDFDADEVLPSDDDSAAREGKSKRELLSKFERKKLRRARGHTLTKLRERIYKNNGLDENEEENEEDMDMSELLEGMEGDDAEGDDEDMIEMGMDELLAMEDGDEGDMLEGDDNMLEGDLDGLFGEGDEGDEGDMLEFDESMIEEEFEEDEEMEEVIEQSGKKTKTVDMSDKLVQLADVAPVVPKGAIRILTPADFKKIELLKQRRMEEGVRGARRRQKNVLNEEIYDQMERMSAYKMGSYVDIDEDDIGSTHAKKRKMAREDRIANQKAGREQINEARTTAKYGHKVNGGDQGGRTNDEKLKTKNFVMVKHSRRVRNKAMAGFQDKQKKNMSHIATLKNMGKNLRKGIAKKGRAKHK